MAAPESTAAFIVRASATVVAMGSKSTGFHPSLPSAGIGKIGSEMRNV